MNLTALQTFLSIIDEGSLVRASQVMNVTQSTVTARLKTLEDEIGQPLLVRRKSGTTLTPAGIKLQHYARIMTGLWRQARYETSLPEGLASVCTFGCDRELWHGPGRDFFNGVVKEHPEMAVSVQQGSALDLQGWLTSGAVDVILTFDSVTRGAQTVYPLPPEQLVLYATDPNTAIDNDPLYIFVDHGEDYRRQHAETYFAGGVARVSFDSSWWALQSLLDRGGSAYLPEALAAPYVEAGQLHSLPKGPVYTRKKNLIVNDAAARNWSWLPDLVTGLQMQT